MSSVELLTVRASSIPQLLWRWIALSPVPFHFLFFQPRKQWCLKDVSLREIFTEFSQIRISVTVVSIWFSEERARCWSSHQCPTVFTTALLCLEVPQYDNKASSKKLKNSWLTARSRNAQVCGTTAANKNRQAWFQNALLKSGWIL